MRISAILRRRYSSDSTSKPAEFSSRLPVICVRLPKRNNIKVSEQKKSLRDKNHQLNKETIRDQEIKNPPFIDSFSSSTAAAEYKPHLADRSLFKSNKGFKRTSVKTRSLLTLGLRQEELGKQLLVPINNSTVTGSTLPLESSTYSHCFGPTSTTNETASGSFALMDALCNAATTLLHADCSSGKETQSNVDEIPKPNGFKSFNLQLKGSISSSTSHESATSKLSSPHSNITVQVVDLHQWYPNLPVGVGFEVLIAEPYMIRHIYRRWNEFQALCQNLKIEYPLEKFHFIPKVVKEMLGFNDKFNATRLFQVLNPLFRSQRPAISAVVDPKARYSAPNTTGSRQGFLGNHLQQLLTLLVNHPTISQSSSVQHFVAMQPRRSLYSRSDSILFEDGVEYVQWNAEQSATETCEGEDVNGSFFDAQEASECSLSELASIATAAEMNASRNHELSFSQSDADTFTYTARTSSKSESLNSTSEKKLSYHYGRKRHSVDDYQLVLVLGKGCMGKVLLAREKSSSRLFAIKAISKHWVASHGPLEIEHAKAEQRILAELHQSRNPFLIRLHSSFQNHENLFLVLDYVGGGDLASQLAKWHRFCENRSRFYCAEMVEGIKELHRLGIIYRDLKPENVLLSPTGHIVLTDFGLSKQFRFSHRIDDHHCLDENCAWDMCEHAKTNTFCGTAEYLAPEILREEPYGYEVDWWSLGTFLCEMLTGMTPFWAESHAVMYRRVLEDELELPGELVRADARDLLSKLLTRNPTQRLGYGKFGAREIMFHPFFADFNWDDLANARIQPPYVPQVKDDFDLSHFDEEFTKMTPRLSPAANRCEVHREFPNSSFSSQCGDGHCICTLSQSVQDQFNGYSFVGSVASYEPDSYASSYVTVSEAMSGSRFTISRQNEVKVEVGSWKNSSKSRCTIESVKSERRPQPQPMQSRYLDEELMEFEMEDV